MSIFCGPEFGCKFGEVGQYDYPRVQVVVCKEEANLYEAIISMDMLCGNGEGTVTVEAGVGEIDQF